jgi:hypothetical protein
MIESIALPTASRIRSRVGIALVLFLAGSFRAEAGEGTGATRYTEAVEPILANYCYGCHGLGSKKGGVALDEFADSDAALHARDLWLGVLKNVRAGIMPPPGKPRPTADEVRTLETWIKRDAFAIDPADPDPGRVTLRRLNRVEYRNTIRDLMGFDFRADEEFPADDSGYGFDNIGEVLSVSPLLLEKYLRAAELIVQGAVPTVARAIPTRTFSGFDFRDPASGRNGDRMTFYKDATVERVIPVEVEDRYRLTVDLEVDGNFEPEPGRCHVTIAVDGLEFASEDHAWHDNQKFHYSRELAWKPGPHPVVVTLKPLNPDEPKKSRLDLRVLGATVEGPLSPEHWLRPKNFDRFFPGDEPTTPEARKTYLREVVTRFATKAFRRPVDARTLAKLIAIAESTAATPGRTLPQAAAQAMIAVIASPRFLFRIESVEPSESGRSRSQPIDEYALASRLSYFLWSTMPDDELFDLAERRELRKNLPAQIQRMLADARSDELVKNFTGQWLEARDIEHFPIQGRAILRQDGHPVNMQTDGEVDALRRLMRRETEAYVSYVVKEDRSILEFLDSDYTFVNDRLAKHYGLKEVTGRDFRRVTLPSDSPRGGLITQAGLLMVTSNPSRTSPVKRGAFLLENFLGSPTPPPPPDIPALEEARRGIKDREPTVREVMAAHRSNALCASCHARMDPLGLALENFNALGMWRDTERKQPIDPSGQLLSGQSFKDVRELKRILKTDLRLDFYRCLTEKLLTYALGRGLDYRDVETVDRLVLDLDRQGGKFSALLVGIIESAPFQRRRDPAATPVASATPAPAPAFIQIPSQTPNGTQP